MPDIINMGEALIDFVPKQVDCTLEEVSDFHRAAGGGPANVAVGIARLEGDTGFMGKVGEDAFGKFLKSTFDNNKVDTSQLVMTDEAMTTLAFVSLRSDGERDFAFYRKPGADMLYEVDEVDFDYLKGANMFHFGSISLIVDPSSTTTLELIKAARKENVLISFDPNIRPPLWDSLDQAITEIKSAMPLADIVKINEGELEDLTGIDLGDLDINKQDTLDLVADACHKIYEMGPELVIVTLGGKGSFYYYNKGHGHVEGFKVKAIDTTGAGDGFVAAVLTRLNDLNFDSIGEIAEEDIEQILRFANKVASITTTRNGGIPSLPTLDEIEDI